MGLRNGNTVHAILGIPLTSPDAALNAYAKIVQARRITITFSRRGKRMTHEYIVR